MARNTKPKQLSLNIGNNLSRQFPVVDQAAAGAAKFMEQSGGTFSTKGLGDLQNNPRRSLALARDYTAGLGQPQQPGIEHSYNAMAEHVDRQYDHLTKPIEQGGMGYTHQVTEQDPYDSPQALGKDLQQGRISTFASASTGNHEYFTPEQNDKFRAVHDVFGHGTIGRGFSEHGEEAAFLAHRQMFPPEAHAALASETRGQNAYLNFNERTGTHFSESGQGQFASQGGKLIAVPSWAESGTTKDLPSNPKGRIRRAGAQQMSMF